jgi:uncharacterized repeat protein (TIGR01451 family)
MNYQENPMSKYVQMAAVAVAVLAGALWSGEAHAQSCNLATNGSFESPNIQTEPQRPGENTAFVNGYAVWRTTTYPLDGWQTVSGTVDMLRYFNNASDGLQSIDLWGTAAATIRQTFTGLTPGRQYSFSVDYSGLTAADSIGTVQLGNGVGATPVTLATLQAAADAVSNGNAGIPNTPSYTVTWRTYQHTFTAVGTEATVQFVNRAAPSAFNTGLFIDNFSFAGVGPCETDLAITKTDGVATYTPGLDATYTIVVTNNGSEPVTGAQISDPLPNGITQASWTCGNATGGGVCGVASGTGAINTTANLPAGASVTYRLSIGIPASYSGNLTNTATVTAPTGVTDTEPANNTASDTNTMESPPTSSACSPVRIVGDTTFNLAPFTTTGTVQKSGAPNGWNPDSPWSTFGGNYTIRWTFSQPVPANWIRFAVSDVGAPGYETTPARFTVGLGAGSAATLADFSFVAGWHPTFTDLDYNASTGVMSFNPSGDVKQAGALQGNSTDTVTSITITASNVNTGDHIINALYVRPACMTVQKASEGTTGSFAINMTNVTQADGTVVPSTTLTTTTPGTAVSSPAYKSLSGTAATLSEVVPAGWGITSAVCTDQNAGTTGNPTVISTFASPTLTIPAANVRPEADIVCRFDNGSLPTISLLKITSQMAGGPFEFTLGNTTVASPAPVSTADGGIPVAVDGDPGTGTDFKVSSLGADVTIDESNLPAGWAIDGATCTDAGGALVGSLAGGRYTIPSASITMGQTFNCSFVNEPTTNLRIDKIVAPETVRPGDTVTYTITASNDGPGSGDDAVVADPPVAGVDCTGAALTCNASGGAVCPASLDVAVFQSTGLTIPAFPAGGSLQFGMACTVTATGL